jgi:ketosteroid isomerase-like protein
MKFARTIIAASIIVAASAYAHAQTDEQKAEIAGSITTVMNAQAAAWNRGDLEGFMQGYWRSEKLVFVSGENVTRGWQPTLDRYRKSYSTREIMGTLTFSDLEINVLSKDSAYILGNWALKRATDEPKGKFTLIFRRFKEGWRIVHDHTS